MRSLKSLVVVCLLLQAGHCNSQEPASTNASQSTTTDSAKTPEGIVDDFKPAVTNQAGKEYPQVNSQGRIKFRIVAPDAKSVATTFRDSTEFVKGDDGIWTGYSRPLDEGFHYYELIIDGAHVPDPNSKYYFGAMRWGSGIEIPAHDRDFYALKHVPHGQVREIYFHSESTGQNAELLSTRRRLTTVNRARDTQYFIYNMVGVKTNMAGASKATRV